MLSKLIKDCSRYNADLVAVSKTKSIESILNIYNNGQRAFGENRVPELVQKQEELPKDILWHFIGNLQSNKVKQIIPFVHLIHSVDRKSLLKEINKQAGLQGRKVDILLQSKIAREDTKSGASEEVLDQLVKAISQGKYSHVNLRGFMGMATFTEDKAIVANEFKFLRKIFDRYQESLKITNFDTLSMGMSGDYLVALENGSTMIRVGSLIFGKRNNI
jgi:pyridoxal phosphate enzyme (YggS family)